MHADGPIRVMASFDELVRRRPEMFFTDGIAADQVLARQLMSCAAALGALDARLVSLADWVIVGSEVDWWLNASHQISEDLNPSKLTAVPEWGQNSVRPEVLIALLAKDVGIKKDEHLFLVKGSLAAFEALRPALQQASSWKRAVAFRGTSIDA